MEVQRLNKQVKDSFALAQKYYQIISVLNDLGLAQGEIQLVAYSAIMGNMADPTLRKAYCEQYGTTPATINNIVYRLKKKNIFLKKDKKIFVNPSLTKLDFSKATTLVVSLTLQTKPTVKDE